MYRLAFTLALVLSVIASGPNALAADGCSPLSGPGCGGCACEACVCQMDDFCCSTQWDDICVGECQECGGCGGGTPTPGGCGSVTYEGCCSGQTLMYCEGGQLQQIDCNQSPSCGWQPEGNFYDCGTQGSPDPSGMNPMTCTGGGPGPTPTCGNGVCEAGEANTCPNDCGGGGACGAVTYEGCCSGQTLMFCDGGQLQQMDCGQNPSCGWQPEGNYYDCGTSGSADPSGMNPIACTGGGPGPTPTCGNGVCEMGETGTTCPADCQGGCVPQCNGKQCGDNGCGGSCGTCSVGTFCNLASICESETGCTPQCNGKQCGDDGCQGSCGECPAGLICQQGQCVPPGTEPPVPGEDIITPGDASGCIPLCQDKACGDDGCGGLCGSCEIGYVCNLDGMCEVADDPYKCPEGQTLLYGKCVVPDGAKKGDSSGCTVGRPLSASASSLLAGLLLAVLFALGRRTRRSLSA